MRGGELEEYSMRGGELEEYSMRGGELEECSMRGGELEECSMRAGELLIKMLEVLNCNIKTFTMSVLCNYSFYEYCYCQGGSHYWDNIYPHLQHIPLNFLRLTWDSIQHMEHVDGSTVH